MKSYRSRNLSQGCQIAKDDGAGNPLKDGNGNVALDHGGQRFLKVSVGQDNCRLIPLDHSSFFAQKAKEIEEALRADGIQQPVSPEEVYHYYTEVFNNASKTFAPQGKPEEFSMIVPRALCVNWAGGGGSVNGAARTGSPLPQLASIFARLRAAKQQPITQAPAKKKAAAA